MPAYLVVQVRVTDPKRYDQYRPVAAAAIAKHGGTYIVRGGPAETLEGATSAQPARHVVIEFPSLDAARRFWKSPDYEAAKGIRAGAADMTVVLVDGYSG